MSRYSEWVSDPTFSPDGRYVVTVSSLAADVVAWETATGRVTWRTQENQRPRSVAFSNDGSRIAVGREDGTVHLLDEHGASQRVLPGHSRAVTAVAFARTGQLASSEAVVGYEEEADLLIRDASDWQQRIRLRLPYPMNVSFDDAGTSLAVAAGGTVHLFDLDGKSWQRRACELIGPLLQAVRDEWLPYADVCR